MPFYTSFSEQGVHTQSNVGVPQHDQMDIAYIDIGQGDCTLISCPDDLVIVVDCGSVGAMPVGGMVNLRAMLRLWANGNNVDIILTHPDRDHYNQILNLINAPAQVGVDNVYFSRALNAGSPFGNYYNTLLGSNLHIFQNPPIHEITINAATLLRRTWDNSNGYVMPTGVNAIPAAGYIINNGVTANGTAWSVKIIAGNVPAIGGPDVQSNAASLVTLVEFGANSLLLTADSTPETMNYLLNNQHAQIQDLTFFQMPHHGSESNLPPAGFAAWVDPRSIIISVGLLNDGFKLPRWNAINQWINGNRINPGPLVLDYWVVGAPGYNTAADLNNILNVHWNGYNVLNNGANFFWLANPDDADPMNSNTIFYGFTTNGYFLYRETINSDIWATGVEGNYEHFL